MSEASRFSNYGESLTWLYNFRRILPKRDLNGIKHLLAILENPQEEFESIHITGTNGKGSTVAMIASILKAEGFKVGMFTSPHLSRFTERIVIDESEILETDVLSLLESIRDVVDSIQPIGKEIGFFDIVTALAFKYFAEKKVDVAVIEAGMGGRLDATNVVNPLASIITNVSLEHTDILGKTVFEIAREKAGIIKKDGVLITATDDDAVYSFFKEVCRRMKSRIYRVGFDIKYSRLDSSLDGQRFTVEGLKEVYEELFTPLLGYHQIKNASTAIGAVESLSFKGLNISRKAIYEGLANSRWPGRLEIMHRKPLIILDCAKDPEAIRSLKETLLNDFVFSKMIAVISISSDKDISSMIRYFSEVVDYFIITAHKVMGRAAEPSIIAREVEKYRIPYELAHDVKDAIQKALSLAKDDEVICVTGSVFIVGEARDLLKQVLS
ncbi:bifunctional folylpolyglutamate synthase/dihydrofolate synthase [Candidatus Bathyarchaeota archaeon]|nr:bifunctional folylpolyglutamate synthase/dihydrofolate synthase [Candidatus Bathyarchaeota archaeon]